MIIEFPIRLISELAKIEVADDVLIRRIDDATRRRALGIYDVVLDDKGRLKQYGGQFEPGSIGSMLGPELDLYDQLYSSNYVVVFDHAKELPRHFNFALKIIGPSCSSLFVGHENPNTKHFISPPCYYGDEPLIIDATQARNLSELLALKRNAVDPKLDLMAEMFLYAMSVAPREESRFVELSVILEMLLLPTSSAELSYRFALRMSKLLHKCRGVDSLETFASAQRIYRMRSRLVHSGRSAELSKVGPIAEEAVRDLLKIYLRTPEIFSDSHLDEICVTS